MGATSERDTYLPCSSLEDRDCRRQSAGRSHEVFADVACTCHDRWSSDRLRECHGSGCEAVPE